MSTRQGTTENSAPGVFGRVAATFGGMGNFAHFGERLAAHAHVDAGDCVLDVATGRGAVAFPAAKRAGPHGRVIGVDTAAEMIRETAKELASGAWPNIEVRQMDAEHLECPDASFDCVLCGFALWFFPHPDRALQEFHRVLKPGGRLALTTWAYDSPYHNLVRATLRSHLPAGVEADGSAQTRRFDTEDQLEGALQKAGFVDTSIFTEDFDAVIAGADLMWGHLWSGGFRRYLERMSEVAMNAARADLNEKLKALTQPDGIHVVMRALFSLASRKPALDRLAGA